MTPPLPSLAPAALAGLPAAAPIAMFEDILVPYQKPLKLPLPEWAAVIRARFEQWRERAKTDLVNACDPIVTCYNEAALLEVHFGRMTDSAALCEASLEWLGRCSRRAEPASVLRFAFQPFINLGRLDRIYGRYDEALRKFRVVGEASRGQAVDLGSLFLSTEMCQEIFARADSPARLARTIYVLDSLKTLLKAGLYQEVVNFAPHHHEPGDVTARDILAEAASIALCRMGRFSEAMAAADRILADREGPNRTLFLFRRAEIFAMAGQRDDALRVARKLAAGFLSYPGPIGVTRLGMLSRLAMLLSCLGADEAGPVAELGYRNGARVNDVLLRAEFLNTLAGLPGADSAALRAQARAVKRDGWYGVARERAPEPGNIVDALSADLRRYAAE
jgi:tetratricopeptide (TPR) repeat protein